MIAYFSRREAHIARQEQRLAEMSPEQLAEHRRKAQEQSRRYSREKPALRNALTVKRRADQMKRVPKWADLAAIRAFYKACPPGYQVDHIIPLRGKTVSGLHVLNNLQYLLAVENVRKSNRFEPDTLVA
jgi:5-methylcytosine-specific restriction endonuclease McrA